MNKKIRIMTLTIAMFICTFFISAGDVKAEGCKCYYMKEFQVKETDQVITDANQEVNTKDVTHTYLLAITFQYGEKPFIINNFCEGNGDSAHVINGDCKQKAVDLHGSLYDQWSNIDNAIKNNCSFDSCSKVELWYHSNFPYSQIYGKTPTDGFNQKMDPIEASQYRDKSDELNTQAQSDTDVIKNWGEKVGNTYTISDIGSPCGIISVELSNILSNILWIISIVGILLVIVMTAISFIKAITGSDDEKFKQAVKHLWIRIVVIIILLLLPVIVGAVIGVINKYGAGEVQIGDDNNIFCNVDK